LRNYAHYLLTARDISVAMITCERAFYSVPRIFSRVWSSVWGRRQPLISLIGNVSYRRNLTVSRKSYADFLRRCGDAGGV
jgi:hypothetical protein